MNQRSIRRSAASLLEVLIAISIISLLLQLLLPAVMAAREAARRTRCANNLRNIAVALMTHHETFRRFPSGGWSFRWVGEPERGTDIDQPGGWVFNILDRVEQPELRAMGKDLEGGERLAALEKRCGTPLDLFSCPSRRSAVPFPQRHYGQRLAFRSGGLDGFQLPWAGRSDYAVNSGDYGGGDLTTVDKEHGLTSIGPDTLAEGDTLEYPWPDETLWSGICFVRSRIGSQHITDGLSNTYLVGEKNVNPDAYARGVQNHNDNGDAENMYTGFNDDTCRSALRPPMPDTRGKVYQSRFGSAHASGFQMVYCDGSLRLIAYSIDPEVHKKSANRHDAGTVSGSP